MILSELSGTQHYVQLKSVYWPKMDISALGQRIATPVALKTGLPVIVLSAVLRNARETITNVLKMTRRKRS